MSMSDKARLSHMLDAAREARAFADGRVRRDLDTDRQLVWALVKVLEIIGEAAAHVNVETRGQLTMIPWDQVVGMRNRLVHVYFGINLDIVWKTVQVDVPNLIQSLEAVLPAGSDDSERCE